MAVINDVLSLLEQNRGQSVSGEAMAKQLYVSRNTIWKAVKQLKQQGYPIHATTNRGYVLDETCSILSREGIEKYLKVRCRVMVEPEVSSTNTVLKQMAANGAPHATVLVAAKQTQGKGRMGRTFYSPDGIGIYLSLLLRFPISMQQSMQLTVRAAVAVARAIESVSDCHPKIKWVNDIYVNDKKVCGILTEASSDVESGQLEYAVVGIGVNLTPMGNEMPDEIRPIAGALFDVMPMDMRNRLAAEIINQYFAILNENEESVLENYRARSWLDGALVDVITVRERYPATVLGIGDDFSLRIRRLNGEELQLSTGEVSIKKR